MRKLYAFLFIALFYFIGLTNEVAAQNYTFTTSNGNTIDPGTTFETGSNADDATVLITLPFTYQAYNISYTQLRASTNGNLQFTTSSTAFSNVCPLPSATVGVAFLPHWDDLILTNAGHGIYTSVTGSAPNRIFNIEWRGRRFGGTNPVSFEARLFEGQQRVDFIYGANDLNGSSASIGVQNSPLALQTTFSCNTASLSAGLGVSFTLATPCSGVPSPGFITGPTTTVCSGTPTSLSLNSYTTGGGITIQWKSSATPGGPYTNIAGATNPTYNFNASTTTYYVATVTCTISGFSATTSEFALNVSRLIHSNVIATPTTGCAPASTVITGSVSGGVVGSNITLATSGTINLAIPDGNPAGANTTIVVPAATISTANALKIRVNVNHTWVGDLKFTLTSPCGTTFLFDRPGVPNSTLGNSDNLGTNNSSSPGPAVYIFDLAGATVLPETNTGTGVIAAGTYKPSATDGSAHNWSGMTFPCATAGNWTLNVADFVGIDQGTLVDWAIIRDANYTHTLTGPGTITQNASTGTFGANGSFNVSNLPAGTHTFVYTSFDAIGCSVSTNVTVTVNPVPVVTITPTTATICNGAIQRIDAYAAPQVQQTFTNLTNIHTPPSPNTSGIANPYPSGVAVTGLPATGSSVNSVTLGTIYHTFPDDIDVVLVSPTGQSVILMSDCGGGTPLSGQTFTLSDAAAAFLADNSLNASGTYKPTNYDAADNWPAPGPGAAPTATTLSTFTGNMNGTWNLYVVDDNTGNTGVISTWSITFNLDAPVIFSPTTNLFSDAAATIPYTGAATYTVWARPTTTTVYTASNTVGGCVGTATSTITVNQLPAITVQPAAVAASCPGFNVTYSVTATGTGLSYQWQLSTNGGTTWTNLSNNPLTYAGVNTNVLTVINPQPSQDNYQYRVVITGTCPPAVTSNAVTMRISTPPVITAVTTSPTVPSICVGGNITFTVTATGSPIAPTIYQWQVSTDNGVTWTNLTTGGSYTNAFTITGATAAQNNTRYRVIVTNSCGQSATSASTTLTVNPAPTVTATALTNRICISDTLVPLVGTPVGGSWSGLGVSGFNFIPSATGVGTYTLTYTYTSPVGCTNTSRITVKVEDCPERIRRLAQDNAVLLFPNPNNGRFNIKVNSTLYNFLGMRVYSSAGQLVHTQSFNSVVYGRVVPVDLRRLPQGVYTVKIFYDDGIRTSEKSYQVVIQK